MMDHIDKFNSELTEAPFISCCVCEINFEATGVKYIVEKSFKRVSENVQYSIYEYAICWDCAQKFQEKISPESNQAIQTYFFDQLRNRPPRFFEEYENPVHVSLSECMVKGTKTTDLTEYTMCGVFRDGQFSMDALPYVLSSAVLEEIAEKLSASTKDEMDDFRETYLGGPPELEELFKGRPVVFL